MNPDNWVAKLRRMNWLLVLATAVVAGAGLAFVYSASFHSEEMRYMRQAKWLAAGAVIALLLALMHYRRLAREGWWLYGAGVILLLLVLAVGSEKYGGKRWIEFHGVSLQPSELAKLGTIVLLARLLSRPDADLSRWRTTFALLGLVVVPFLLVLVEPDLGSALVFPAVGFLMLAAAGVRRRILITLVALAALGIASVAALLLVPERMGWPKERQERALARIGLKPYHQKRLEIFLDSSKDPTGAGYNKRQARIAIGSGGWSGKGYLNGAANVLGFLPKKVAPTDFIFCVVAEEMGFIRSTVLLVLYGVIVVLIMMAAVASADKLGRLLCVGVAGLLFVHVFVNVGMTMGLLPIVGIPLPLMSCGGTYVVCTLAGLGLVQSVYVRRRAMR